MRFYIEFEIPQLRGIYCKDIKAINLEEAKQLFAKQHPNCEIIKIEGRKNVYS